MARQLPHTLDEALAEGPLGSEELNHRANIAVYNFLGAAIEEQLGVFHHTLNGSHPETLQVHARSIEKLYDIQMILSKSPEVDLKPNPEDEHE